MPVPPGSYSASNFAGAAYDVGTMKIFTACVVRADQVYGLDKRYVHFDTTSISVYGEYLPPEGQLSFDTYIRLQ